MDSSVIAFILVFLLIIFFFTIISSITLYRRYNWTHSSAKITDVKLRHNEDIITATLRIEYFVDDERMFTTIKAYSRDEDTFKKGNSVPIFIDPERPHRCAFDPDVSIFEIIPFWIAKAVVARRAKNALKQRVKT